MLIPDYNQDIPESTIEVARAAFPKGNPYLTLRDQLGTIYADEDFVDLFPELGQPALAPWRLALVTVVQFRENLTDRQAAEAVRSRIDVKYLLGLDLTDPGFDFSVLSEFRSRLLEGEAIEHLPGVGVGQSAWQTAYRRHPCPGGDSGDEPPGAGSRNNARCLERVSGRSTHLAAKCRASRVVQALRPAR